MKEKRFAYLNFHTNLGLKILYLFINTVLELYNNKFNCIYSYI